MSDTPETDANVGIDSFQGRGGCVSAEFARRLERERDMARRSITEACDSWAEDHTHLQDLCKAVGYSDLEVYGDEYGVPGIIDLANLLRGKIIKP